MLTFEALAGRKQKSCCDSAGCHTKPTILEVKVETNGKIPSIGVQYSYENTSCDPSESSDPSTSVPYFELTPEWNLLNST